MKPSLHTPKARVKIVASSSRHEPKKWAIFSTQLVGLIIFFSATQLGLHFWPNSSLVYGVRVDYLSPTLYFLDLLILFYLFINWKIGTSLKIVNSKLEFILPILLLNLLYSQNPFATLSWTLHFLLYYFFLATTFENLRIWDLRLVLTLSLLFQLALAITQISVGHSVGGLMYYLGERSVAVGQPSVALATFLDNVVLRAYGTFSHPNILAGWAVVVLIIIYKLKNKLIIDYWLLIISALVVFLSQSRSAAIALFAIIIPFYILKSLRQRISYFFVVILLLSVAPRSLLIPSRSDLSTTQRLDLQGLSSQVIANYPIFGTGAQASISTYPSISPQNRQLQPDHNSFTLFLSWFGVFGVLAIIFYLKSCLKFDYWNLIIILPLAPLLLLDHYLLTSPQGLFISMLYIRVANTIHKQG